MAASVLTYARQRIRALLEELSKLGGSDFPYKDSASALEVITGIVKKDEEYLKHLDSKSDPETVIQCCMSSLSTIVKYLQIAGLILRSTNVRNAFEVVAPFRRLASQALEPGEPDPKKRTTRLIISSEWDYSPFTYHHAAGIPGFVMIGLPAHESGNPLLIPLAGHELGHALWAKRECEKDLDKHLRAVILSICRRRWANYIEVFPNLTDQAELENDVFGTESWAPILRMVTQQSKETFSDYCGVLLFGESFLHAHAYLLSPCPEARSPEYPSLSVRISNLVRFAAKHKLDIPNNYEDLFTDEPNRLFSRVESFRLEIADEALGECEKLLRVHAEAAIAESGLPQRDNEQVERIHACFRRVVPPQNCKSLADILNGGWKAALQGDLWSKLPEVAARKDEILKELILKSIEVFDIEEILRAAK